VAQLSAEEKNRVSHRAQAALKMRERLIARGY
jgi:inosine/xanthosine triphosphate pyrophosphatase family protein